MLRFFSTSFLVALETIDLALDVGDCHIHLCGKLGDLGRADDGFAEQENLIVYTLSHTN